jgi:hypothetical protein
MTGIEAWWSGTEPARFAIRERAGAFNVYGRNRNGKFKKRRICG